MANTNDKTTAKPAVSSHSDMTKSSTLANNFSIMGSSKILKFNEAKDSLNIRKL